MQQFSSLLSWRLFTAQHVSGVFPPIIRISMTAVAASGFTFVSWWQSCCVCGRAGRPARPRTQHDYHHDTKVKPEAATALTEFLMMGGKTPEICWAVNKRQDNKLENYCIWLVIYLNCENNVVYGEEMWCQRKTPVQTAVLVTALRTKLINNPNIEVIRPTLCKKALKVSEAAVTAVPLQCYTWKDGKDVHLSINHFVLFVLVIKEIIKC
jgi:hypothetical protein